MNPCEYVWILNVFLVSLCMCVFACVCVWPCHEAVLWKSASQWWRVYWLVDQAPSVSTWQEGDPSRPSYWHTELICSAWSIPANWNYHCTASHVSALFVWLLLVLCVFVCVFMEVEGMICIWVTGKVKPRACLFCACRRGELFCGSVICSLSESWAVKSEHSTVRSYKQHSMLL